MFEKIYSKHNIKYLEKKYYKVIEKRFKYNNPKTSFGILFKFAIIIYNFQN